MTPPIVDENVALLLTKNSRTLVRLFVTARKVGMVWQGGVYMIRGNPPNEDRTETRWISAWGSNPQQAMKHTASRVMMVNYADEVSIEILEAE